MWLSHRSTRIATRSNIYDLSANWWSISPVWCRMESSCFSPHIKLLIWRQIFGVYNKFYLIILRESYLNSNNFLIRKEKSTMETNRREKEHIHWEQRSKRVQWNCEQVLRANKRQEVQRCNNVRRVPWKDQWGHRFRW